ncbi:hypothetical protein IWX49DRAFT_562748 [Phyllosticta citricarpa]
MRSLAPSFSSSMFPSRLVVSLSYAVYPRPTTYPPPYHLLAQEMAKAARISPFIPSIHDGGGGVVFVAHTRSSATPRRRGGDMEFMLMTCALIWCGECEMAGWLAGWLFSLPLVDVWMMRKRN